MAQLRGFGALEKRLGILSLLVRTLQGQSSLKLTYLVREQVFYTTSLNSRSKSVYFVV